LQTAETYASVKGIYVAKPNIDRKEIAIMGVTDAADGDATTIEPTSGVYVKVKSNESLYNC